MSRFFKVFGFFAFVFNFVGAQLSYHDSNVIEQFKNWVVIHKIETNDNSHLDHIFKNWLDNDKFISLTNAKNLSYTLGHNKFSHLSVDEFRAFVHLGLDKPVVKGDSLHASPPDVSSLPASIDWRTLGAVTPVKDQGQCKK